MQDEGHDAGGEDGVADPHVPPGCCERAKGRWWARSARAPLKGDGGKGRRGRTPELLKDVELGEVDRRVEGREGRGLDQVGRDGRVVDDLREELHRVRGLGGGRAEGRDAVVATGRAPRAERRRARGRGRGIERHVGAKPSTRICTACLEGRSTRLLRARLAQSAALPLREQDAGPSPWQRRRTTHRGDR